METKNPFDVSCHIVDRQSRNIKHVEDDDEEEEKNCNNKIIANRWTNKFSRLHNAKKRESEFTSVMLNVLFLLMVK